MDNKEGNRKGDMASRDQIDQFHDLGYFIADDAVGPDMLEGLTAAARRVVARVRSGEVVDDDDEIRTNGEGDDSNIIMGLLAPEFAEPVFAEYLGSELVFRYVRPLIGEELRLGWLSLFVTQGRSYHCGWHRDIGGEERDGSFEVEMEILGRHRKNMIKWHMALVDDPCLWIVPGSHRRYRTDQEREVLINNRQGEIPEGRPVELKIGQTIFWNGNAIHRGLMPEGMEERLTLMGALVNHRSEYSAGEKGDHRWLLAENIREGLPQKTGRYYDNWRSLAEPRMGESCN